MSVFLIKYTLVELLLVAFSSKLPNVYLRGRIGAGFCALIGYKLAEIVASVNFPLFEADGACSMKMYFNWLSFVAKAYLGNINVVVKNKGS